MAKHLERNQKSKTIQKHLEIFWNNCNQENKSICTKNSFWTRKEKKNKLKEIPEDEKNSHAHGLIRLNL